MTPYVSAELHRQVAEDAGHRCGYCLSDELLTGVPLTIEHILPMAKGGAPYATTSGWHADPGMNTRGQKPTPRIRKQQSLHRCSAPASKLGRSTSHGAKMAHWSGA